MKTPSPILQYFIFSVIVRICSHTSYLFGFSDIFALNQQLTYSTHPVYYGGPQVPTFVQRPGTPQPHRTTISNLKCIVWCHDEKSSVVWLWCRCACAWCSDEVWHLCTTIVYHTRPGRVSFSHFFTVCLVRNRCRPTVCQ